MKQQECAGDWQIFMGISKLASVRKIGLSLSLSNNLIIFLVYALVILMRLQVNPRKQVDAYDQLAKWITSTSPSTAVISLTLDTLALPSLSPTTTLLKAAFV